MRLFFILLFTLNFNFSLVAQEPSFEENPLSLVQEYTTQYLDIKQSASIKQEQTLAFLVSITNSEVTQVKHLATKRPSKLKLAGIEFPQTEVIAITKYLKKALRLLPTGDESVRQQEVIYVDVSQLNTNSTAAMGNQN